MNIRVIEIRGGISQIFIRKKVSFYISAGCYLQFLKQPLVIFCGLLWPTDLEKSRQMASASSPFRSLVIVSL